MEHIPPKNEILDYANQREKALQQLETIGNFWIGPDISLREKITVPPGEIKMGTPIILSKKSFPNVDINRGIFGSLGLSVRSCLAQSGIDIRFFRGNVSDEMIKAINEGKEVSVPVDIENNGNRPLELEGNIMRFFWVNDRKRLRNQELREVIGKDLIIEGEEGKEWSLLGFEPEDEFGTLTQDHAEQMKELSIRLPITPRFYIPNSDEPINIKSKKDLPNILQEIPDGKVERFTIGETAKVKLSENIAAVICTGTYGKSKRHIFSPLIDPRFEGKIRTETLYGLDYIELFVYKK